MAVFRQLDIIAENVGHQLSKVVKYNQMVVNLAILPDF
jgi:hypothetical protein